MESTYSATLDQPVVTWKDQTPLAGQKSQPIVTDVEDRKYQRNHIQALDKVYWPVDSTSDGGVGLRPDSSSFVVLIIYLQGDQINKVLLRSNLSEATITKSTGHSLSLMDSVPLPPHLEAIRWIEAATGLSQERIGELIGVTRQTINRWERGEPIRDHNRRRLFAVHDVLERAAFRHPTPNELAAWLDTPRGADGCTPAQLLEANEINRARLLAVSTPSPRLKRAPSWVNRPIPEAFRAGAERRQEALPPDTDNELAALLDEEHDTDEDGEVLPVV